MPQASRDPTGISTVAERPGHGQVAPVPFFSVAVFTTRPRRSTAATSMG